MKNVKAVIFDLGGTLIYSNHEHFENANAWMVASFLRSRGYTLDPEAFARRLVSLRQDLAKGDQDLKQINTTSENLVQVASEFGIALSGEFLFQCEKVFVTPEVKGSILLPNIRHVLKELSRHYRLGLISNTRSHLLVTDTLRASGLESFFNPVVTSVSAGYRKPSPKVFQAVLETWQLPASEVLMIGDSLSKDVAGAQALGMHAIWLTTDSTETGSAELRVAMPQEILGLLPKLTVI